MSVLGVTTDAVTVIHTVQQYRGVTERGVARSVVLGVTIDTVQRQYYGVSERCDGERSVVQ